MKKKKIKKELKRLKKELRLIRKEIKPEFIDRQLAELSRTIRQEESSCYQPKDL